MKTELALRPDTIRELRAALAENNLQKYISTRLGHASCVHSGMPSGTACLMLKRSSVVTSGDDMPNGSPDKRRIEYARPVTKQRIIPLARKPNAAPRIVHGTLQAAEQELAETILRRPGSALEIAPVTRWYAEGQRAAEIIGYQVVEISIAGARGKSLWEPASIKRRPGVFSQLPAGIGIEVELKRQGGETVASGKGVPIVPEGRSFKPQASAAEISRADEAAAWNSLIPQDKWIIRRVVAMATTVDARTGKQKHSFPAIALAIGADKMVIGPWLHQGIAIIADALKDKLAALGYAVRKTPTTESAMDLSKPINPDTMLTRKETSEAIKHYFDLNLSYGTLTTLAFKGIGPKYFKISGTQTIRYRWSDVCAWIIEESKPRYASTRRQMAMA